MLISIKRIYLESGLEVEMMINTLYIIKIQPVAPDDKKPRTRIIIDTCQRESPNIIYTNETLSTLKAKVTRSKNKRQEVE